MTLKINNISNELNNITEFWQPKTITTFNQMQIKMARLKNDYDWHNHKYEDKLFYVIAGQLFIKLKYDDKNVTVKVNAGELVVVPKNTLHKPFAPVEASVLFFEPLS
ncbi:cupin domain-containing protein [Psychrobacter lutiphocae]|uniref:cupin domain-containing protein n=1 Tax=Psychrobacter lutiphocae TaxID=540500 RepID=UPI00037788C7|nr:cupin domain-containing protein [Psychrobacter lutiphocae]